MKKMKNIIKNSLVSKYRPFKGILEFKLVDKNIDLYE